MSELIRLQELNDFKILDTPPEKEFDELAQIASALFDAPISLISFIDEKRQWYKAKVGIGFRETSREDAFCNHTIRNAGQVLVVNDLQLDERFRDNPYVKSGHIRFYAGAPLETRNGNVLGSLCIADTRPREITKIQENALKLLAKKVMDHLEVRKKLLEQDDRIELSATLLKKLSDLAPGVIYQLEITPSGSISFPFISRGIETLHPELSVEKLNDNPELIYDIIHPDDIMPVKKNIRASFLTLSNWNMEYRVIADDGSISWHWAHARPERKEDGTVVWYGTFQDVTGRKEHIKVLEKILFDISHIIRKPVATLLALTNVIETDIYEESLQEYVRHIKTVANEMDQDIRKLNATYAEIKVGIAGPSAGGQAESRLPRPGGKTL
jgi:hypothetical protein